MSLPPPASPVVLHADNHLLVVSKPAGMPVQPDSTGAQSLYGWAKDWLREQKGKVGGEVFCGIVHRLDRNVSGVCVLARTSKAASRLSQQWAARAVDKRYLALVAPPPEFEEARLEHWLLRDEIARVTRVVVPHTPGAQLAQAVFWVRGRHGGDALVEVELLTGRSHQIRAQLGAAGAPIAGDAKYGSRRPFAGLGLHAHYVEFSHPTLSVSQRFTAPLPRTFPEWTWAHGVAASG